MDELLCQLEGRLQSLMQKYTDIKSTNTELVRKKQKLTYEREYLLEKQKNVSDLIENTIAKLKTIEGLS